jgi:hypothetical protein
MHANLCASCGLSSETITELMVAWHIMRLMTARPNINAIPAVVAATPGTVNSNDLPLRLGRGVVPVLNNYGTHQRTGADWPK